MTLEFIKGLGIFAGSGIVSSCGYHIRNNFSNQYIKEFGAALEVGGHLINYTFYADAFKDSFIHKIDGILIAQLNFNILPLKPVFVPLPDNPITGELLIDDIKATPILGEYFNKSEEYIGHYKYFTPYIIGKMLLSIDDTAIFKGWESIAHLPEKLPASNSIGLLSYLLYNLPELPYVGEDIDKSSNYLFSQISEWSQNPGGDTKIGEIYRDYILTTWEGIHKPHHFYEEIKFLSKYNSDEFNFFKLLGDCNHAH
ncbi:MAG: hypothetical protein ACK4OM_07525 [Alphaproteobacteria bacterium]